MKNVKLFFLLILSGVILTSCSNDDDCSIAPQASSQAKFTGVIGALKTRATDKAWDANDAIGIYALNSGQTLSEQAIYDQKSNVKYTTTGDGVFTAVTDNIDFPQTGKLDFIAYYPYQENITNFTYPINVTDQSKPAVIDLLYSNDSKDKNKLTPQVSLTFRHMLSKLVLNIGVGNGITSLEGLTASIENALVDGSFSLVGGLVTKGSTSKTVTPLLTLNSTKTMATVTAILVPGQDLNTLKIKFMLNGKNYEWTPTSQTLASTTKYTHALSLTAGAVVSLNPSATIEDWTEGNTGGTAVTLNPNATPVFQVDKTTVSLEAKTNLSSIIKLTTQSTQAWTATSNSSWLTATASGTGSADITATAQENTTTTVRTATVTVTATGGSFSPVVITINQAAKAATPTPTANTLFSGSDFEDWNAFTGGLNSYGLNSKSVQSTDGRNGSKALNIKGTHSSNIYVFTAKVPNGFSIVGKSKIVFYIKGATTSKSISVNLYKQDGSYYKYNLLDYTQESVLDPVGSNNYSGSINTNGQWMKVTLNISGLSDIATTEGNNLFALKVGKGMEWDMLVDDITIE